MEVCKTDVQTVIRLLDKSAELINEYCVTPHVGVWIETLTFCFQLLICLVTPHVGVWIETFNYFVI